MAARSSRTMMMHWAIVAAVASLAAAGFTTIAFQNPNDGDVLPLLTPTTIKWGAGAHPSDPVILVLERCPASYVNTLDCQEVTRIAAGFANATSFSFVPTSAMNVNDGAFYRFQLLCTVSFDLATSGTFSFAPLPVSVDTRYARYSPAIGCPCPSASPPTVPVSARPPPSFLCLCVLCVCARAQGPGARLAVGSVCPDPAVAAHPVQVVPRGQRAAGPHYHCCRHIRGHTGRWRRPRPQHVRARAVPLARHALVHQFPRALLGPADCDTAGHIHLLSNRNYAFGNNRCVRGEWRYGGSFGLHGAVDSARPHHGHDGERPCPRACCFIAAGLLSLSLCARGCEGAASHPS